GHRQRVVEMRIDCDQDAVWIRVEQEGAGACHTGRRSCFYRAVPLGKAGTGTLEFRGGERTFDPAKRYPKRSEPLSGSRTIWALPNLNVPVASHDVQSVPLSICS